MLIKFSSKSPLRHLNWLPMHEEPQAAHDVFAQSWHRKNKLAENTTMI